MTFQRKLLFGFSLMVLPALLVGAEAIRSNALERRALTALGESMARTRTYAELETAMFDQSELIWRYLSGLDPTARQEFQLNGAGRGLLAGPLARRAQARGDTRWPTASRASSARSSPSPTASSGSKTPAGARRPTGWRSAS